MRPTRSLDFYRVFQTWKARQVISSTRTQENPEPPAPLTSGLLVPGPGTAVFFNGKTHDFHWATFNGKLLVYQKVDVGKMKEMWGDLMELTWFCNYGYQRRCDESPCKFIELVEWFAELCEMTWNDPRNGGRNYDWVSCKQSCHHESHMKNHHVWQLLSGNLT